MELTIMGKTTVMVMEIGIKETQMVMAMDGKTLVMVMETIMAITMKVVKMVI